MNGHDISFGYLISYKLTVFSYYGLYSQAEAPTWAIMSCSEVGCTTTGSRVLFGTALDFTVSL